MSSTESLTLDNFNETLANVLANSGKVMPAAFTANPATNGGAVPFVETGYASIGFLIISSAMVMLMTPAVGLLYSGLSRSKNALTIIMLCFLSYCVVAIQWVLLGFSLSFSESGSAMLGNFIYGGMQNVTWDALAFTAPQVPMVLYALYQMQFATVTCAIIFGSVVERIRILPSLIFMFVWTTAVYDPIAYWTWGYRGWIKNMSCPSAYLSGAPCGIGGLDFAGGGPVHMSSGAAALAFCIFLGHRKRTGADEFKPHNITNVFLGTALLWFGWFGFNAASASAATPRAAYAALVTTVSASSGALAWVLVDYVRTRKMSGIAFCSGALAGLVGITPASGYVNAYSSIVIGIVTAITCAFSIRMKEVLGYDDSGDAWGIHGVGGLMGSLLTGLFANKAIATLDGSSIPGGAFFDGQWSLLGYNTAGSLAIISYSFIGTYLILICINMIPGLHFRVNESDEAMGGDLGEMGEVAYEIIPSSFADIKSLEKTDTVEKMDTVV